MKKFISYKNRLDYLQQKLGGTAITNYDKKEWPYGYGHTRSMAEPIASGILGGLIPGIAAFKYPGAGYGGTLGLFAGTLLGAGLGGLTYFTRRPQVTQHMMNIGAGLGALGGMTAGMGIGHEIWKARERSKGTLKK